MKVLLDGRLMSNKNTGISRYSYELTEMYCREFGRENVTVLVPKGLAHRPFKSIETQLRPFAILDFLGFHSFVSRLPGDIYHSFFYSGLAKPVSGKFTIMTVHDVMYRIVRGFFGVDAFRSTAAIQKYNFIISRSLANSDAVISVSDTTRRDVARLFKKESLIVGEGINCLGSVAGYSNLEKFGLNPRGYLLYVGNSRPHKNLSTLVKAFTDSNSDKKLALVGDMTRLGPVNRSKVRVIDYVSDSDLLSLYENCAAFILPSIYEGFGLPVLEALSHGAKVICSSGGALDEFPDDAVLKFRPDDVGMLKALIQTIDSYQFDPVGIKKCLDLFTWKSCEENMKKIWARIPSQLRT